MQVGFASPATDGGPRMSSIMRLRRELTARSQIADRNAADIDWLAFRHPTILFVAPRYRYAADTLLAVCRTGSSISSSTRLMHNALIIPVRNNP
jgi:hypothetical protein